MNKAVKNFNFNYHAITEYFILLIEIDDEDNIFIKKTSLWEDLIVLLIEALKLYSDKDIKFDFHLMFKELYGKIPYKGNRKKIEKKGGELVFSAFNDAIIDSLYNIKMDKNRRRIIISISNNFRKDVIISLKKEAK